MRTKIFFIFAIIIAVIAGAVIFFRGRSEESSSTNGSAGLFISNSAIYVAEQTPGPRVSVSVVRLEKPGFVLIHEDAFGAPGKILGVSNLLPRGETKNLLPIVLSRPTRDNEIIYAMLHFDNGDGKFDASNDKPALDSVGDAPVMMIITISKDAIEPGAINP